MASTPRITWTKIVPSASAHGIPCARSSHGLSIVRNGSRLILLGGEHVARTPIESSNSYWAADLLDETRNSWQWRLMEFSKDKSPADRIAHAQAVHEDKFVYMFGGRAGITMQEKAMNDLWKLDVSGPPGSEAWTKVVPDEQNGDPVPEARSFHRMICIGSNLYVFGGCTAGHGRSAELYRFDLEKSTWHNLGASPLLRGRGGPNLMPLSSGRALCVLAGFCGEETRDGHIFNIVSNQWEPALLELADMRPRSVCVSGSFPSIGKAVVFGGEVDPSDRGHEGAGAFENDVVVLDEKTGLLETTIKATSSDATIWPSIRGWSDAAVLDDGSGVGQLFLFGGLSGDDENPVRMNDLWKMEIRAE